MDGSTLNTEGEKEQIVKCTEAALVRRVSKVIKHIETVSTFYFFIY